MAQVQHQLRSLQQLHWRIKHSSQSLFINSSQVFGNGTNFGDFHNTLPLTKTLHCSRTLVQTFLVLQTFGSGTGFAQDQTFNGTQDFSAVP